MTRSVWSALVRSILQISVLIGPVRSASLESGPDGPGLNSIIETANTRWLIPSIERAHIR